MKLKVIFVKFFVALLILSIFGFISIYVGQDVNWDFKNYHYYNPFAFINDLHDQNIFPAQLQSFFNPFMHLVFFYLTEMLNPKFFGFIIGAIQGINFILLLIISKLILGSSSINFSKIEIFFILIIVSIIGVTSPMFAAEFGTSLGDNIISIFVLGSIIIMTSRDNNLALLFAGILFGIALGFKLTAFIFTPILIFINWENKRFKIIKDYFIYVLGILISFIPTQGYWSFWLYKKYDNPLFPYFNDIFKSEFSSVIIGGDKRYIPQSFSDALLIPWKIAKGGHLPAELFFQDIKFLIVFILVVIFIVIKLFTFKVQKINNQWKWFFFFVSSWGISLKMFGIQRYIIVLELLSGVIILILLVEIIRNKKIIIASLVIITTCIFYTLNFPTYGRLPWKTEWVEIKGKEQLAQKEGLYLILGQDPLSYIIPKFDVSNTFIRVEGNYPLTSGNKFYENAMSSIERKGDNIYVISIEEISQSQIETIENLGLRLKESNLIQIETNMDPVIYFYPCVKI